MERYTGTPPPERKARTWVVRITSSETQQFIVLSKSIFGQDLHYFGKRTHKCTKQKSFCRGCHLGWSEKWAGYLHCLNREGQEVFIELTKKACDLLCLLAPVDQPLRGLVAHIKKTKGGPKGRFIITLGAARVDPCTLPQERDPLETLEFLWQCKNQHLKDDVSTNGTQDTDMS